MAFSISKRAQRQPAAQTETATAPEPAEQFAAAEAALNVAEDDVLDGYRPPTTKWVPEKDLKTKYLNEFAVF